MTNEEIDRLLEQAVREAAPDELYKYPFARLVAAHTLAKSTPEVNALNAYTKALETVKAQVKTVEDAVLAEREACAKMVDHILKEGGSTYGDAIRARGQG
jgi:hypothetical protein